MSQEINKIRLERAERAIADQVEMCATGCGMCVARIQTALCSGLFNYVAGKQLGEKSIKPPCTVEEQYDEAVKDLDKKPEVVDAIISRLNDRGERKYYPMAP
ncbi:MAG: hypothetical protein FWD89_03040 [Firmicutes bacterium]|nr:hypothetical protein [Bacillota bacterium]MCL2771265.1 hypothetical protein [Bacillota bacterium]